MFDYFQIFVFTILIECFTITSRFVFKKSSKKFIIGLIKQFNFRYFIHIHHGFIGIFVTSLGMYYSFSIITSIGLALIISDVIHHLFVLWPITGSPEFHIIYKVSNEKKEPNLTKKLSRMFNHFVHKVEMFQEKAKEKFKSKN